MNWFKKRNEKISVTISGVNPQTDNEFKFYEFVSSEPANTLEAWYKKAKQENIRFKKEYEKAIKKKIKTGTFYNPINFRDYFGLDFDFIAIDFETANEKRISACALGIVFVKNNSIVNEEYYYIKPPKEQRFKPKHIRIHGITPEDVENSESFDYYWKNGIDEYFNNNLIVFHNASMDLSILRQLFELHKISDFDIDYLDTMNLASYCGMPKKLTELANVLDIEIIEHHNPVEDAKICAHIFANLSEMDFDYKKIIYKLSYQDYLSELKKVTQELNSMKETYEDCDEIVSKYLLKASELCEIIIPNNAFLFTGDLKIPRYEAQDRIKQLGGIIKNGISSKVNYVVLGSGYGWSKVEKIDKFNSEKGLNIKIINEEGFNEIMKNTL